MAQPQQYIGEGGAAPALVNGVVQEGTRAYRETFRAQPFTDDAAELVPGRSKSVPCGETMKMTESTGTVRQTIAQSITIDPCPNVEYGRIQTTLGN
jgi:hypothetical protein